MKCPALVRILATLITATFASCALAADIVLTPPAGGAVAVADTGSGTTRFRVADDGTVTTTGSIFKGADRFIHTFGTNNLFLGVQAGNFTMGGINNTAVGNGALAVTTSGSANAAIGDRALAVNTTGGSNAATGFLALFSNTTGFENAGFGAGALQANTVGVENTAFGGNALSGNTNGNYNTAVGSYALLNNSTGDNNIAVGRFAGSNVSTGNSNIVIGGAGNSADSNTTRIGSGSQTRTFISGIRGVTTGSANAIPVMIDGNGQLGTVSSSGRFKDDIADMDSATDALMQLRPVTFHYKADQDPEGRTLQYGLVAEEVAQVYPGLVARSPDGQVETVMYQFLPSMLLNEVQKLRRANDAMAAELAEIKRMLGRPR